MAQVQQASFARSYNYLSHDCNISFRCETKGNNRFSFELVERTEENEHVCWLRLLTPSPPPPHNLLLSFVVPSRLEIKMNGPI